MQPRVNIIVKLPQNLAEAAKTAAATEHRSVTNWVHKLILEEIDRLKHGGNAKFLAAIERIEQTPPPDEYQEEIETGKYKPLK